MTTVALKVMIIVRRLSLVNGCATEVNWHFCVKILLFVRDLGRWNNDPTSGCDFE